MYINVIPLISILIVGRAIAVPAAVERSSTTPARVANTVRYSATSQWSYPLPSKSRTEGGLIEPYRAGGEESPEDEGRALSNEKRQSHTARGNCSDGTPACCAVGVSMWSPLKCYLEAPCDASGRSVYGITVPVCCLQTTHGIVCSEPDDYVPAPAFPSRNSTHATHSTSSSTQSSRLTFYHNYTYSAQPTSDSTLSINATHLSPVPTLSNLTTNVTTHAGSYLAPSNPGAAAVTTALATSRLSVLAIPTTASASASTWAVHVLTSAYPIPKSPGPFTLALPIGLAYYAGAVPATHSTITASAVLTAGSHSTPASLQLVCPVSTSTLAALAVATSVKIGLVCLVSYEGSDLDMGAANAIAVPVAFGLPISAPTSAPVSKFARVTKVLGGSAVDVGPPVMVVPGTETVELSQAVSTGPTVTVGPPVSAVPTVAVPVAPSNIMSKVPACSLNAGDVLNCIR